MSDESSRRDVSGRATLALRPFAIVRESEEWDDSDACDESGDVTVVCYGLELPDRSVVVVWARDGDGYGGVGQFTSPERALAIVGRSDPACRMWLVPASTEAF